jgi:hypothetical protein
MRVRGEKVHDLLIEWWTGEHGKKAGRALTDVARIVRQWILDDRKAGRLAMPWSEEIACRVCGKMFVQKRPFHVNCSRSCAAKWRRRTDECHSGVLQEEDRPW